MFRRPARATRSMRTPRSADVAVARAASDATTTSANGIVVKALDDDGLVGDPHRWERLFAAVLDAEDVAGPGEATLVFVDAVAISQLNQLHMGEDAPTDVLSFPIDGAESLHEGERRVVGDVVICAEVAAVNAPGHTGGLDDELALLICHGVLHLLGHDHAEPEDRQRMWRRERELLAQLWTPLGLDPWATA